MCHATLCRVSMRTSAAPLQFVLSAYDINGTWLGLHNWTLQFQVCGARVQEASKWTRYICHQLLRPLTGLTVKACCHLYLKRRVALLKLYLLADVLLKGFKTCLLDALFQALKTCCCVMLCRFGVNYASSCSIDLTSILAQTDYSSNGPRFYDPYLVQVG